MGPRVPKDWGLSGWADPPPPFGCDEARGVGRACAYFTRQIEQGIYTPLEPKDTFRPLCSPLAPYDPLPSDSILHLVSSIGAL